MNFKINKVFDVEIVEFEKLFKKKLLSFFSERKDTKGGAIDPTNYDFYTRPKNITYRIYDE